MIKLLYLMRYCYKKNNYLLKVGAVISFILILMALPTINTFGSNPPSSVTAQQIKVTGTVVGAKDKVSIPGVSVLEKGTTNGTVTDVDGKFTLTVQSPKAVLVFSFIGYLVEEKAINGQSVVNISLREDIKQIEDVIVVGYGTAKKSDISGSVATVSREEMLKKAPTNILQSLQGVAAGVMVTAQDGAPDANAAIRIRGVATINGDASPLFVVDGVQVGTNANFLNPSDIESVSVLKDASATAIYGSRGANGVVMITTKHGNKGVTRIDFTVNYGVQTLPYTLDTQGADSYAKSIRTARATDAQVPVLAIWDSKYDGKRKTIDWQKEMTRTSIRKQYDLSISGGSDKMQSAFSAGYLDNEGLVVNSYYKRLTSRVNVKGNVADFIEIGGDINFVHDESMGSNSSLGNNTNLSSLRDMAFITPTMDYIDSDGTYVSPNVKNADGTYGVFYQTSSPNEIGKGYDNPYARQMELDNPTKTNRVFASAFADIKFFKGFHFKSIASYNFYAKDNYSWTPLRPRYNNGKSISLSGYSQVEEFSMSPAQSNGLAIENYFTYNWKNDIHNLTVMAGNSVSNSFGNWQYVYSKDFPATNIRSIALTNVISSKDCSGAFNLQTRTISYYGRAMYTLKDRYILTGTIRRDGSSNFGAGNRWGTFPSAALAWRVSEENFMKAVPEVSNLKLRLSWGLTGNAGSSTDLSVNQLSSSNTLYHFYSWLTSSQNFSSLNGYAQQNVIDTNLKWETNESVNAGIDFGLFHNKVNVTLDYFIRTSKDLLLYQTMRPSTGFTSVYTNFGEISNKGFEFSVAYNTKIGKDWKFGASLTGSTMKNKVVQCGADIFNTNSSTTSDGSNVGAVGGGLHWDNHSICREGYAVGSFYGFKTAGLFRDQAELDALNATAKAKGFDQYQQAGTALGDIKYVDTNGDGHVTDTDKEIIGNGFPDLNFGLTLSANYKNWDFSVYTYGVLGQDLLSYSAMKLTTMTPSDDCVGNVLKDVANDAYSATNKNGKYPRLTIVDANYNTSVSDYWIKNGNFLKISNVQIGYTFDKKVFRSLPIESTRVYVTVQNALCISGYNKYGDPEAGQGSVLYTGLDTGRYPNPRTFTFGLNIKF